ncbi:MAG: hypoxanthine phosphoribosyltransferase [Bacteroidales bacterium]|nr:hypoxanthine phosphoribosyltransferase [Bacteroidales bacterium]MDD4218077.1 hypoxanthine phosphoribosyltransferase [Bacteroidales bacterium]MDY0143283.1 hypoxanthine phosphoribosyltransferase [Bacteroidales bacterium]
MDKIRVHDKNFKLFISNKEIENRIKTLANNISKDLKDKNPLFLGILNGSFMFAGELFKNLDIDCGISFLKLASYDGTSSSGKIKRLIGLNEDIKDRTVVILEDIIDTGITIDNIVKQLKGYEPAEIKIASLLIKSEVYNNLYKIDYFCFDIPNEFIIGYGLDYNGLGRNLKHIYKISE